MRNADDAPDQIRAEDDDRDATDSAPTTKPLKTTFGTAVGAAMVGFEQALRSEPPAEVMAADHAPARGQIGGGGTGSDVDDDLVIVIPEPPRTL